MTLINPSVLQCLTIDQVLNRHPLTVSPNMSVADVVDQMGQLSAERCQLSSVNPNVRQPDPAPQRRSCALIIDQNQILGIFTERDLVRLVAAGVELEGVAIAQVMSQPVQTLQYAETYTLFSVLSALREHQVRQLPILDQNGQLLGLVTQTTIRQALQPFNFLKLRRVEEVMTASVIQAAPTDSLMTLVQQMAHHLVSCVVITESQVPIGIVTERDIVQFRAIGLSLTEIQAQTVMSAPLFLVHPQTTLWDTHQHMQQRHIRRLVVADEKGQLAGIITQTSLLAPLDPVLMIEEIEQLQQLNQEQTLKLSTANQQLQDTNQKLQASLVERDRLETILLQANQHLEERMGVQAAQLVQIDEELQAEIQERHHAQIQLEQFFALTPSLLCIAGLDGYFQRINSRFTEILGYTNAELMAKPFIDFVHSEDQAATLAEVERLGQGAATIAFLNRYCCKDGTYRWFSWNATANPSEQVIYAAARDVTNQKQMEVQLKTETNFNTAILETVGALVAVLDRTGTIIRFNHTCEQVSGYQSHEVIGNLVWDVLIPPEEKATVSDVFHRLQQGELQNQHENFWMTKDGKRKLITWSNTVLTDDDGRVDYIIGTGIDVTEQRQAEEHLAQQYQQQQLLAEVTRSIRDSLDLNKILETAATGIRTLLGCDRVLIIQIESETTGRVIQEAMDPGHSGQLLLNERVTDLTLINAPGETLPHTCVFDVPDSPPCSLHTCQWLHDYNVKSCVEVAIHVREEFWGLITIVQCDSATPLREESSSRHWETFEINLVQQIANQLGIAISQSQLLKDLEQQVNQRTAQLSQTNTRLKQEIQERMNTELELRENQQRLSGILDNADEAIISIDQNQQIVLYNQGAEKIFGYTADEALGQSLDLLLPSAFHQSHWQYVQTFATAPESTRQMAERSRNVSGRRKNGEEFPAEASISKLQTKEGYLFTVMLKDITARQQAEDALRRSEEQLRLTTDALPVLICYVDGNQRYRFLNQTYADWFQRPVAELCGQWIGEVIGQDAYERARSHIEAALAGRRVHYEMSRITPDGKARDLDITYIPDVDIDGTVNGFFSLINDISDRKATERLKDEFVSVVGHELRTPLTSIHGSLKLLATKRLGTLAPQGQNIVDIALRNTERLTRLINDVLDLERIQSGRITMNLQDCELSYLMTQAIQSMQSMANEYDVQLLVNPLETSILADPDHLTQVFTNLLSNAIKFSNPGGTVWLNATPQDNATLLSVQDQGRGIPPDKIDTIFERFQQVDASDARQRGGTGLGLTICQQIVQQHNGRIWVESTVGEGSAFFFSIPHKRPH